MVILDMEIGTLQPILFPWCHEVNTIVRNHRRRLRFSSWAMWRNFTKSTLDVKPLQTIPLSYRGDERNWRKGAKLSPLTV